MVKISVNIDFLGALNRVDGSSGFHWAAIAGLLTKGGAKAISAWAGDTRGYLGPDDLAALKRGCRLPLHLESDLDSAIPQAAFKVASMTRLTPVDPEAPGFDLSKENIAARAGRMAQVLKKKSLRTGIFLQPSAYSIRMAKKLGFDAVELNARGLLRGGRKGRYLDALLEDLHVAGRLVAELGMELHLGGGLDYQAARLCSPITEASFVHAGPALAFRALESGLQASIEEMVAAAETDMLI